ncbi:hypothetical protein N9955_00370 [bacterium]|nr:hypothetical protein [bacterium]
MDNEPNNQNEEAPEELEDNSNTNSIVDEESAKAELEAQERKAKAFMQWFRQKNYHIHLTNFPRNQRKIRKARRRSHAMGNKQAFKPKR